MSGLSFDDLPMIRDEDEMRRVHNDPAMYYLSRGLVAHADMTCHLAFGDDSSHVVQNPSCRMATAESRRLGAWWCQHCCS